MKDIALISTPWPLYKRPSIQLGSLKAFLHKHLKDAQVDAYHLYLDVASYIGYDAYSAISESSWFSEALYGSLLFPEKEKDSLKFLEFLKRKDLRLKKLDIDQIRVRLKRCLHRHMEEIGWSEYRAIGFSICFSQLMSSLLYMKRIKELHPKTLIIAGGSHCSSMLGSTLVSTFQYIDLVVEGEGERPLFSILKLLREGRGLRELEGVRGVVSKEKKPEGPWEIEDLNELPFPDFDDYFSQLKRLSGERRFFARIPMEASRGCWYRGSSDRGCSFCNLNLQWKGFRYKDEGRVLSEIDYYLKRYQSIFFSFMDNLIPRQLVPGLFKEISGSLRDLKIFLETRADLSLEELMFMREAGVEEIQVGIEALSTSLLKKMKKGTTAIQNIEFMKACETPSTPLIKSNLILDFPSSDERDVQETLETLRFVRHLRPLKPISFWLGYGSRVYRNYQEYGIAKRYNHPYYSYFIPGEILKRLVLMIQAYRLKRGKRGLWRPVREKVAEWNRRYERLKKGSTALLALYDAKYFLIIVERVAEDREEMHRLLGKSREIYLFCDKARDIREIVASQPSFTYDQIRSFLDELVGKGLMFRENSRYLSLAVRAHIH